MDLILATSACDPNEQIICTPESVNELFELPFRWGFVNRYLVLTILAVVLVYLLFVRPLQKRSVVPGRMQSFAEMALGFVRDEIAVGIIGPKHGLKYFPYLASIFFLILVGNLFEVIPLTLFPITSRIGLPVFLAILTWIIFLVAGIREQGLGYFSHLAWPPGVPVALKPLVGLIELVSVLLVRPFSLAVRLFANLAAGHVMLSLLLLSSYVMITSWSVKTAVGIGWGALALGIYLFEILVAVLQAYIFTLLSAVYIQTSVEVEDAH